jgi:pyridoxamine 5'-phosphate oxidase family protein
MAFNEDEKAYLRSQRIARLATVSDDGQPDVTPVGFEFDGRDFYIGGMDLPSTRKYRNVRAGNNQVALVVDDIVSTDPWTPRFLRVHGMAQLARRDTPSTSGEVLHIAPTVSWSWNLDGRPFGDGSKPVAPRKVRHAPSNDGGS